MLGPVTGVVISESILGETPTIPINMLDKDRFERGELLLESSVV
jgi:sarcosine oxidase subunit beta